MTARGAHLGRPTHKSDAAVGIEHAHLLRVALPGQQIQRLGDEGCRTATRSIDVIVDELRAHPPVRHVTCAHRGVHDPIAQREAAQDERREKIRVGARTHAAPNT